jgi:hypothetical protein
VIDSAVDALIIPAQAASPGGKNGNLNFSKSSAERKLTKVPARS